MASNNNNSTNLTQLASKAVPTSADLVMISDQAAGGIAKQATISSLPISPGQITTENIGSIGLFSPGIPGMFGSTASTSQTASVASIYSSNVIFIPFYVSQAVTAAHVRFGVAVGVAASSVTVGFYNSTVGGTFNNFPTGAPISAASVTTTVSATFVNASITAALSKNLLYWMAMQASTATVLSLAVAQLNIDKANIITQVAASALWTANILTYANAYSAGTLPTLTQSSIAITPCNYLPITMITV